MDQVMTTLRNAGNFAAVALLMVAYVLSLFLVALLFLPFAVVRRLIKGR
jgi:Na+-translocating ferredoxin:NAD+ oxidoreductase RnfE subunit